jgi:hypothetical protein
LNQPPSPAGFPSFSRREVFSSLFMQLGIRFEKLIIDLDLIDFVNIAKDRIDN